MSKLEGKWIDIFRAGTFPDKKVSFSAQDVQQIVDNYDAAQFEAPAVIGHPKHDHPAYAWFSELRRDGDVLQGKPRQVVPEFENAVLDGRFKNRSVKLVKDAAKGWTLRHVGFLGALLPEVKGLTPISFSDDAEAIEIEFSEEKDMAEQQMTDQALGERFSAWLNEKLGGKKSDAVVKTFSEEEVKQIATDAAKAAAAEAIKPFEVKFSERETALATTESGTRAAAAIAKVKSRAGAWVPAFDKMGVPQLFAELAKQSVTIEFGEGADKRTTSPLDIMVEFMESLPAIVPTTRIEIVKPAGRGSNKGVNAGAFGVDDSSVRLHEAAVQFSEENKVEYAVAIDAVIKRNPDLARIGGASTGTA